MCQILTDRARVLVLVHKTYMCLYWYTYSYNNARARDAATVTAVCRLFPHAPTLCSKTAMCFFLGRKMPFFRKVIPRSFARPLHILSRFQEKVESAYSYSCMLVCACTRIHTRMCSFSYNNVGARAAASAATAVCSLVPHTFTFCVLGWAILLVG